jgi:hypothetical protein
MAASKIGRPMKIQRIALILSWGVGSPVTLPWCKRNDGSVISALANNGLDSLSYSMAEGGEMGRMKGFFSQKKTRGYK